MPQHRPDDNREDAPAGLSDRSDLASPEAGPGPQDRPRQGDMLRYIGVGTEFFLTFAILLAAGVLLDIHLGTLPGLTIAGAAAGFALATYRLVRQARQINRDAQAQPGSRGQRPGESSS